LEEAREPTLEVEKEEAPKAKGGKKESQATMIIWVSVNRGGPVSMT